MKPTCLYRDDQVDLVARYVIGQRVDRESERVRVREQRRDVFEVDSGTWKVNDLRDVVL